MKTNNIKMKKSILYWKARNNEPIEDKKFSNTEIKDIVEGQFFYFQEKTQLKSCLGLPIYVTFEKDNLKKILRKLNCLKKKLQSSFEKENKVFETVFLHLVINCQEIKKSISLKKI